MIDDINLHEWAEYNVPAELRERAVVVLSPFARRVLVPTDRAPAIAAEGDPKRRLRPSARCSSPGSASGPPQAVTGVRPAPRRCDSGAARLAPPEGTPG